MVYAHCLCGVKRIKLDELLSLQWGVAFSLATVGGNRFWETMKYLRFDMETQDRQIYSSFWY
jgi:hypothetical protein